MNRVDMEKVIKELTNLPTTTYGGFYQLRITHDLRNKVIALLKEQETSNTGKARIFQCEKCGYGFDDIFLTDEHNYDIEPNYCPNCGRTVK